MKSPFNKNNAATIKKTNKIITNKLIAATLFLLNVVFII